jgi:membrane protein
MQLSRLKAGGRLSRWSFGYFPEEKKYSKLLRSLFRILLIMVHEFSNTNIALRASALTFSVMLSMVPLLAMSTAILKGLGDGDKMRVAAYHFIDQLDPEVVEKVAVVPQKEQAEPLLEVSVDELDPEVDEKVAVVPQKEQAEPLLEVSVDELDPEVDEKVTVVPHEEQTELLMEVSSAEDGHQAGGEPLPDVQADEDITTLAKESESSASQEEKRTAPPSSLNAHLHQAIDTIFDYVDNTNFATLGAFGIVGLLIVVIMVLSSIEDAMNAIWHTRRGRSLFRKIMDYLALLVLLPISINIALAGDAILQSPKIMGYIATVIPSAWVVQMLLKLLPFIFITLSLMMMYLFFPNVKVKTTAAFCGALFGAVFWFIVQRGYVVLQIGVANYNAIYGSFATVPLFLVWIQLGWMFILLGATLAYAIQNRNSYQLLGAESSACQDLQRSFDILIAIYNNFALGRGTSLEELIGQCQVVNQTDLARPLELLIQADILHEIEQEGAAAFIPCRPFEQVNAAQITRLILGRESEGNSVGGQLADQIIQAAETIIPAADFPKKYLSNSLVHISSNQHAKAA